MSPGPRHLGTACDLRSAAEGATVALRDGLLSATEVAGFDRERAMWTGLVARHFLSTEPNRDLRAYAAVEVPPLAVSVAAADQVIGGAGLGLAWRAGA